MAPEPKPEKLEGLLGLVGNFSKGLTPLFENTFRWTAAEPERAGRNFAESFGNFFLSRPQARTGMGAGDIYTDETMRKWQSAMGSSEYSPQVPRARAANQQEDMLAQLGGAANLRDILARQMAGQQRVTDITGGTQQQQQQQGSARPGAATPATVAQAMARSGWRPGPSATLDPSRSPQRAQAAADAELAAGVRSGYANTSKMLADMLAQSQDRFGAAQGDIKNIFGTLANVRAADKAKINQQFMNSINAAQQQQMARTQAAQQQLAMGQQGAATAGAELGAGPTQMPTDSLTSQAVAEGIADSNALQGVWGNLMGAMNMQQQGNVDTSIQGYNYQQAAALDQLRREYEDRMLGIQGQQASLEDQIAQQVAGAKSAAAQQQMDLAMKQGDWQNELDKIRLKAALTPRGSAAPKGPDLKSPAGIFAAAQAAGITPAYIVANANAAIDLANRALNPADPSGLAKANKTPTASDALAMWNANKGTSKNFVALSPYVTAYIESQLKK